MRIRTLPKRMKYAPVGHCIYCGSHHPPLTLEHIIPYALEGELLLPAASCDRCQRMTTSAERTCLREMFLAPRTHLNMKTRRPKHRPKKLKMGVYDGNIKDGLPKDMREVGFQWRELPLDEHPYAIMLPDMPQPGILNGRQDSGSFQLSGISFRLLRAPPTASDPSQQNVIMQPLHTGAFPRMLAKIAHGLAVAEFGEDTFVPALPEYILGRREDYSFIMGSVSIGKSKKKDHVACSLHFEGGYFTAHIQLFAQFGFRPYQVVVGKPKGEGNWYSRTIAWTQTL